MGVRRIDSTIQRPRGSLRTSSLSLVSQRFFIAGQKRSGAQQLLALVTSDNGV